MLRLETLPAKAGLVLSSIALCSLAVGPVAYADTATPASKDETVYVYTNPDGSVKSEKVKVTLSNDDGADELRDMTTLDDVEAYDESQTSSTQGSEIVWSTNGKDVAYSGSTVKDAPVSIKVSYSLDSKQVSASEIAGKSGKVSIRYDYSTNEALKQGGVTTPFTAITALMLDGDSFKNVEVVNGRLVEDGDTTIAVGYAMPGLKESLGSVADDADIPDYFEVKADAVDFETKTSMTLVSAGLMEDLDLAELNDTDFAGTSSALEDATSQLVKGTSELANGLDTLADSTAQLSDGANKLNSGAQSAAAQLPELVSAIDQLEQGASQLVAGTGAVRSIGEALKPGIDQAKSACESLESGLSGIESAISTAAQNNLQAEQLIAAAKGTSGIPDDAKESLEGALALLQANDQVLAGVSTPGSANAGVQQLMAGADQLKAGITQMDGAVGSASNAKSLIGAATALEAGAKQLEGGLGGLSTGADSLVYGINQLVAGTGKLAQGTSALAEGAKSAADGSDALSQGMQTYSDEAIGEIVDVIDNKLAVLVDKTNALSAAADEYVNFSGITEGTKGSVKFVFETDAISK